LNFSTLLSQNILFERLSISADELNVDAYLIGGFVRDLLLDRPSKDIDVVCVGNGIQFAEKFAEKINPTPQVIVYKRFGTALVKFDEYEVEFVGARKESYSADSRKPSVEEGTLEDDQRRRDFTINALAIGLNSSNFGKFIDPFHGLEHLKNKVILTPLEPGKTFSDDPLRMLRAIRFATQLGFHIHESTFQSIVENKERLKIISKERIASELNKIILAKQPSIGFELLFDSGLMHLIMPEFTKLRGVQNFMGIGHKDNFYHTLQVLDNVAEKSNDLWLRWAAILHDIAKPQTKKFSEELGWTFHGHEVLGAAMVPRIFSNLKLPLDQPMRYVQKLVRLHLRPISLTKEDITDSAVRRLLFDAGDAMDDLMILCEADITSKNEKKVKKYLDNYEKLKIKLKEVEEKDHLRNWQPPVSGEDIMNVLNIPPSREVGLIKTAIREAILDGKIPNERKIALTFMLEYAAELNLLPK
jgi:poly(A) polymerase